MTELLNRWKSILRIKRNRKGGRTAWTYIQHIKSKESISSIEGALNRQRYVETLVHAAKDNPNPKYDFDEKFYKMPSDLETACRK